LFRFAFDAIVYLDDPVEAMIARVAGFGYEGIELPGEPEAFDMGEVRRLLAKHGIKASSICSNYTRRRDLVSADAQIRANALAYVKSVVRMASEIGAPVVIAAPTTWERKTAPEAPPDLEWEWAVTGLTAAADYAATLGVSLALEPWNRYETYFLNRLAQALALREAIGRPNVGVMGDLFHMSIEEESIVGAIRDAGRHLIHLHVADSNRAAPGRGHLDFAPILQALREIDYRGYLSMELLPAAADPFAVMRAGGGREFYDQYTKESIEFIRRLLEHKG